MVANIRRVDMTGDVTMIDSSPNTGTSDAENPFDEASDHSKSSHGYYSDDSAEEVFDALGIFYEPVVASMDDHFSLVGESNVVLSRKSKHAVRIYDSGYRHQLIIEEKFVNGKKREANKNYIQVKTMNDVSTGQQIVNGMYAIMSLLFAGFLFSFCLQILLYMALEMIIESGKTSISPNTHRVTFVGVAIGMFGFAASFSQAMVIAVQFIGDALEDHPLAKKFFLSRIKHGSVILEWFFVSCYILIPSLVTIGALFAERDDWWFYTGITWFVCVLVYFIYFASNIIYFEVRAAWRFFINASDKESDKFLPNLKRKLLSRQKEKYSGKARIHYLARNAFEGSDATDRSEHGANEASKSLSYSLWTKLSMRLPNALFQVLEEPVQTYTIDDVQDYRPYMTNNTWGLEKVFCRPPNSRFVLIVGGPGAVTRGQLMSNLICTIVTFCIIILSIMGFFFWLGTPPSFFPFIAILFIVFSWDSLKNLFNIVRLGKDLLKAKEAKERKYERRRTSLMVESTTSEAIYMKWEVWRVMEPTDMFCWIMLVVELLVGYVFPLAVLLAISVNLGILFFFCATIFYVRHYININVTLKEEGSMEMIGGSTAKRKWENMSRLNEIVKSISHNRTKKVFHKVFLIFVFGLIGILLSVFMWGDRESSGKPMTYLPKEYYYERKSDNIRYPTCDLAGTGYLGFGPTSSLLDYAHLATATYWNTTRLWDEDLDLWFGSDYGNGTVKDEQEFVDAFRAREDPNDQQSVYFKMVSMPSPDSDGRLAIILIRGTFGYLDNLADVQLWGAAAVMQLLRSAIPFGSTWTPVLPELVKWINKVADSSLERISFYKFTTKFAEEAKKEFDHVQIAGHSLGGGIALITASQSKIPGIGLSAPNTLITGASLDPVVTEEDLNSYTFNVAPNYDIVPKIDDPADQIQRIECTADPSTAFVWCHMPKQTLCEIMVTCGSENRLAFCECHKVYGYDKPSVLDGMEDKFDELCVNSATTLSLS